MTDNVDYSRTVMPDDVLYLKTPSGEIMLLGPDSVSFRTFHEVNESIREGWSNRLTASYRITEISRSGYYDINPRIYDPHSSYYIPPYFSIFGSSRPLAHQPIRLPRCQVQKNVRPKATHTNRKFYR